MHQLYQVFIHPKKKKTKLYQPYVTRGYQNHDQTRSYILSKNDSNRTRIVEETKSE